MTGLEVNFDIDGDVALVSLFGEARVENVALVEGAIADGLQSGAKHILLDLSSLSFMDSASAGALLRSDQELHRDGGHMVVFGVRRMIARLFDAAGLGNCFDVAVDEPLARKRLKILLDGGSDDGT